jgi:hypothetical protein
LLALGRVAGRDRLLARLTSRAHESSAGGGGGGGTRAAAGPRRRAAACDSLWRSGITRRRTLEAIHAVLELLHPLIFPRLAARPRRAFDVAAQTLDLALDGLNLLPLLGELLREAAFLCDEVRLRDAAGETEGTDGDREGRGAMHDAT